MTPRDPSDPSDEGPAVTPYGLGAIPSPADPLDYQLPLDSATLLPHKWLIGTNNVPRIAMPGHLNQHTTPMCGGYSGATVKRYQEKADGKGVLNLDAPWLYRHSRQRANLGPATEGTTARAVLATLLHEGIPVIGDETAAPQNRIKAYAAVPWTADAIKRALIQYQCPVLIGMAWPGSFFRPVNGIAPKPTAIQGGHLIALIGFDDSVAGGSFLLFNTWGDSWGGRGNVWVPYRYLLPLIHDCWTVLDQKGS